MEKKTGNLARLVYLSRAVDSLSIPIRTAENWIPPTDLPQFIDLIEEHVRALADLFHAYLLENPETLSRWGSPENERCVLIELADVGNNLDLIGRIGEPDRGDGKSATEIVKEQIRKAFLGQPQSRQLKAFLGPDPATDSSDEAVESGAAPDFAAEAEELRRLRNGELKLGPSLPNQRTQQSGEARRA